MEITENSLHYSLYEAFACLVWYREDTPNAPLEAEAALTSRFYLDYVCLLLYAIGEDIAAFIVHFMGIEDDLIKYLQDPKVQKSLVRNKVFSHAASVGIYLINQHAQHEITESIQTFHNDPNWQRAINYRNKWVHEQPPIIAELGIQYARESRIQEVNGERLSISFGGGSPPELNIDELLNLMLSAANALSVTLTTLLEIVIRTRQELGETFDFQNRNITLEFS